MEYRVFCELFTDDVPHAHIEGERYYLLGEDLKAFKSGEQRKPYSKGLFLGMGRREFIPTPALLTLLAKSSKRKATLHDEKGEWLFLCGRDLFRETFTSTHAEGFVLVQNQHQENLGLGAITPDPRHGLLLRNILDRGNYLRHERVVLERTKSRHPERERR